jgi:hypothetical protein
MHSPCCSMPADIFDQLSDSPEPSAVSSWEPQREASASALEAEVSSQCTAPANESQRAPEPQQVSQTRLQDDQCTRDELLALSKVLQLLPTATADSSRLSESLSIRRCARVPLPRQQAEPAHLTISKSLQDALPKSYEGCPSGAKPACPPPSRSLQETSLKSSLGSPTATHAIVVHEIESTACSKQAGKLTSKEHICFDSVPAFDRPRSGKLRRMQAAAISRSGPPQRQYDLRPLQPEPEQTLLSGFMMIDACNVEHPEMAEVCSDLLILMCFMSCPLALGATYCLCDIMEHEPGDKKDTYAPRRNMQHQ